MGRYFGDKQRKAILIRDGYSCVYCGSSDDLTIDHVVPWTSGGPTDAVNGVSACNACNARKNNHLDGDWLESGLLHLIRKGVDLSWIEFVDLEWRTIPDVAHSAPRINAVTRKG
jgi:hypothetical protein